jgi:hypothetical protein
MSADLSAHAEALFHALDDGDVEGARRTLLDAFAPAVLQVVRRLERDEDDAGTRASSTSASASPSTRAGGCGRSTATPARSSSRGCAPSHGTSPWTGGAGGRGVSACSCR